MVDARIIEEERELSVAVLAETKEARSDAALEGDLEAGLGLGYGDEENENEAMPTQQWPK